MPQGSIKFTAEKGFGFIIDVVGKDVFFHASQCRTPFELLEAGQQVQYTDSFDRDGRACAVDVEAVQ